MYHTEEDILKGCKARVRKAQNELYQRYAPLFLSICRRYLRAYDVAEDIMVHAFCKIFEKIDTYADHGSLEGWMKRIVINECLMEIRKRRNHFLTVAIEDLHEDPPSIEADPLVYEELLALLDELPDGYRTVFNLYVIEGYKHKEIAELLGISINTSKSQLILARRKLQGFIKKKYKYGRSA